MNTKFQSCSSKLFARLIFICCLITTNGSFAYDESENPFDPIEPNQAASKTFDSPITQSASTQKKATDYFTIDETEASISEVSAYLPSGFTAPTEWTQDLVDSVQTAANQALALTSWSHHEKSPPTPNKEYNRREDFGSWVRTGENDDCYNTRARVLMRDSTRDVSFDRQNSCVVSKGLWKDPYSGTLLDKPQSQIDIDHIVPLNNAYQSGAWKWKPAVRCAYANFMANRYHLLSTSSRENRRKGDKGPDGYMPPDKSYQCTYLENWLKVKLTWKLAMTGDEGRAIEDLVKENNCSISRFKISKSEVAQLRKTAMSFEPCSNF